MKNALYVKVNARKATSPKFHVGDTVRITRKKVTFEEGFKNPIGQKRILWENQFKGPFMSKSCSRVYWNFLYRTCTQ